MLESDSTVWTSFHSVAKVDRWNSTWLYYLPAEDVDCCRLMFGDVALNCGQRLLSAVGNVSSDKGKLCAVILSNVVIEPVSHIPLSLTLWLA